MKIAVIQFRPQFKDPKGNLRSLGDMVKTAAEAGAKLIVCPELALSGYSMMSKAEAEPLAEVITDFDPAESKFMSMDIFYMFASRFDTRIAWGLVEKDHGTGNLHNTQVMMCPDGSYEFTRKINGFGNDFLWSVPGRANPPVRKVTVDGKEYKIGLLVCRDVRDKKDNDWKEFYEKGDADIVAFSANWGRGAFPATAWMEFAAENNVVLAVSNRYGKEANNDFGDGGICIIYPDARVQCEGLIWSQDCIVYGEV